MKVLLDTNVIVDNLAVREPFHKNANAIFNIVTRDEEFLKNPNTISPSDFLAKINP